MKRLLKNSVFRLLIIIFGNISMVVFLFGYMIPYSLTSPITIGLTILIFAVSMVIFTITMFCELCFDEASKSLVLDADLQRAYTWIKRMKKVDLFGWYKTQYSVFMSLYYRDMDRLDGLATLLEDKVFLKNLSNKLVFDYNSLLLAMEHDDIDQVEALYSSIKETYFDKSNRNKVALIYSFDMIAANYEMYQRNFAGAKKHLNSVQLGTLNSREKSHYYYLRYRLLHENGNKIKALEAFDKAKSLYPQGMFIKKLED